MKAALGAFIAASLFLGAVLIGAGSDGNDPAPPTSIVLVDKEKAPGQPAAKPRGRGGGKREGEETPPPGQPAVEEVEREVEYGDVGDYEDEGADAPGESGELDDNSGPGGEDDNSGPGSDSSGSGSSGSDGH